MSETPEARKLEQDAAEAPWQQERTGQTFFELEIRGCRLLQNARLSRQERQMVLAGTRNDTEYTAIVTQLRSAWCISPKPTQDGMLEQIAHGISGDAAELEVTWSPDPDEAIWWCGVLDPSILELDVMDWSEDWSYHQSSLCAEEDVSTPECVQQAEVLAAEANRILAQARSAVALAVQNRSGFLPPSKVPSSRKGKSKGKLKGKSKGSSCLICGHSVLNDSRKDLAQEVNMDLARFTWEHLGVLILNCLRHFVLLADVVLDCGATETAGGVEAVQILVDAVTQGFPDSRVEVDSLDRP